MRQDRGEASGPGVRRRLARLYAHDDFPHFLRNFGALCNEIRRPEDFTLIIARLSHRLRADRVRYAEVFCSGAMFARRRLPADEVMDAVSRAAREQESLQGPRLRFLFDGVRQFGSAAFEELVRTAEACRRYDVIGVGMGGDEKAMPAVTFAAAYREARRLGLRTTVHAGEFDGPRSVWEALEILEAERVGHGIRAVEDAELVRTLSRLGTPLECCPTSNVRTGVVRAWVDHPIRSLHDAGVAITVNSDDPALFGTTLGREWEALGTRLGINAAEVLAIGVRTARCTFLPEHERRMLVEAMTRAASDTGIGT